MKHYCSITGLLVVIMISLALPAHALTISTDTSYSGPVCIECTPTDSAVADGGSISSWAGSNYIPDKAYAMAAASSSGYVAASGAELGYWDEQGSFSGEASFFTTYQNNSNSDLSYALNFYVPEVIISMYPGLYDEGWADFSIDIMLNGSTVWYYTAHLSGFTTWDDDDWGGTPNSIHDRRNRTR